MNKRNLGQYYTTSNPFSHIVFKKWWNSIPDKEDLIILEPFSGANNIIKSIQEVGIKNRWAAYDIQPPNELVVDVPVIENDSFKNYPKGFKVAITNPPYLAKNSATLRGLDYPVSKFDDLYKHSLDIMLENNEYIAVIIPESFITANLFQDRLHSVISLNSKMFEDTEHPVCLALFNPKATENFDVFNINTRIGDYKLIKSKMFSSETKYNWKFNDPKGNIGVYCVDSTGNQKARFVLGKEIDSDTIKPSSRAITRISGLPSEVDLVEFVNLLNDKLEEFREATGDVLLTAFKGLRADGNFRRRLDYKTIRKLLDEALNEYHNK